MEGCMPMTSPELEQSARDLVYSRLRRSIIMSHFRPGERLKPDLLASEFDVSVTPVREALQMLDQEGLVTIRPRSGHFVTRVTLKELLDWLDLREILEAVAIERAATRITEAQLGQLETIHAGFSGLDEVSVERYIRENRRLHYLIAKASGNDQLAELLRQVHDRLARFMVLSHAGEDMLGYRHEHLLNALRAGDPAAARQAMLDELAETREFVLAYVVREESASWEVGTRHREVEPTQQ